MIPPDLFVDLLHGSVVKLAFRVGDADFSFGYIYRQRHVFSAPGPGGVHYVELGELGAGTHGIVRRCRVVGDYGLTGYEPFEAGDVAVKVVNLPEHGTWAEAAREAMREVAFLKMLNDVPGIVRLHEHWGDSDLREMCKYTLFESSNEHD